jgi:hypothetical protein
MTNTKKLTTEKYKGVTITEEWIPSGEYTMFTSDLSAHSDPTVRKCNCFGADLKMIKQMIDERLIELKLTEYTK